MRLGTLNRAPVLSLQEGRSLGHINGALMDFKRRLAAYLVVDSGLWYNGPFCVPFSAVSGIDGAVMVMKSEAMIPVTDEPDALELARERCYNYTVYTLQGKKLGKVLDYCIDICGRVTDIILENEQTVPAGLIQTVGDGLIILATEIENAGAELVAEAARKRVEEIEKIPQLDKSYFSGIVSLKEPRTEQESEAVTETATIPTVETMSDTETVTEAETPDNKPGKEQGINPPTPHPRTLIGRRLIRDLRAGDGTLIAKNNDIITASLLELARTLGRLVELSECSREIG